MLSSGKGVRLQLHQSAYVYTDQYKALWLHSTSVMPKIIRKLAHFNYLFIKKCSASKGETLEMSHRYFSRIRAHLNFAAINMQNAYYIVTAA